MRISELSSRSGVPVATIKYYLREGLLPAGERTSATQARYGDAHVERLRLVRALVDVPVIASGGAGAVEHFAPAVEAGADAVLAASVFHFGIMKIGEVKDSLRAHGAEVR